MYIYSVLQCIFYADDILLILPVVSDLQAILAACKKELINIVVCINIRTSGYATWFTAGGAIRIGHYNVIDDVITQKL